MRQRRVKLTLESGGECAEALPGWPLGRRCLCTSVCQVQWGNRTQATEWGELAHAFPANQHRLCSLYAPPTTPCPAHPLRRSRRGPAPDLLPALWLQTHPLQTQAGICCQPVSAREAQPCQKMASNHSDHSLGLWPCPTVGQGLHPKLPWKSGSPWAHPTRH